MKGNDNWGDVLCVGLLFMQSSCCILEQLKQALKKLLKVIKFHITECQRFDSCRVS